MTGYCHRILTMQTILMLLVLLLFHPMKAAAAEGGPGDGGTSEGSGPGQDQTAGDALTGEGAGPASDLAPGLETSVVDDAAAPEASSSPDAGNKTDGWTENKMLQSDDGCRCSLGEPRLLQTWLWLTVGLAVLALRRRRRTS